MLVDVETLFLYSLVNSQTYSLLDAEEQYCTCCGCPKVDGENANALSSEEAPATAIEGTAVEGEETGGECTEDTAYTMY